MAYSRTRRRPLTKKEKLWRWFRKNNVYLFLIGVFLTGALFGAMIVAIANAQESGDVQARQTTSHQSEAKDASVDTLIFSTRFETSDPQKEIIWEEYTATAYCSCQKCCGIYAENRPVDDDGKEIVYTASGERAIQGVTIADDWSVLSVGTVVEVDGYGEFTVHDKGGTIKGNKIDIYFESHQDALEFGVKTVNLRVIENGGEKE